MDFSRVDASPLTGRLAALAQARTTYRALTRGAQQELWRPNGGAPVLAYRRVVSGVSGAAGQPVVFVVNGGDILHRWTNERFLSTPHRVRNVSGQIRYAIPFFCDPDHDTAIECLPSCQSVARPAKYPPIKFGDYALWFAAQRYGHMAKVAAPSEAEIAPASPAATRRAASRSGQPPAPSGRAPVPSVMESPKATMTPGGVALSTSIPARASAGSWACT